MEQSLIELYDKKISNLQEIEEYLKEIAGNYDNAKFILSKVYNVINVQKQIDELQKQSIDSYMRLFYD